MRGDSAGELRVVDLHKSFSRQAVLRGVDLAVPAGAITAVLGPSGSGKTTLLRILAGFERPDRGTVSIGSTAMDDDHTHVPPERRRIGYVSQEGNLFPHLTVQSNVGFGLPRPQRRGSKVKELLEMLELGQFADRYPHQLSGGQQQRVALARALAVAPEVVLLDEPFSSLDATLREALRRDVARILSETSTTTVLVTHDQDEALAMAEQVVVLHQGTVLAADNPRVLYGQPPDLNAALSIGEANVIEAELHGQWALCGLGQVPIHPPLHGPGHLLVRPEQLDLRPASVPGDAGVRAVVREVQYHGHDALVRLDVSGAPESLAARVPGDVALVPGDEVVVTLRSAARAFTSPH
ncbi:MAG: ABC transporter ATP-binding protein [Acidimicrobiales bacterium]